MSNPFLEFDLSFNLGTHSCLSAVALRLFPYHIRVAVADTTLPAGGGIDGTSPIFCRAGSFFDGNFAVLHREKNIWGAEADVFDPERWEHFRPKSNECGPRACDGR